jgi:predicted unusual protein kinase regulating ubiquinone biosynthesis (AarF/ABC1/UbiB family)
VSGFLFHWQRVIELPAKELEYAFWDFETKTSGADKAEVVAVLAAAICRSQDSGSKVNVERFSLVEKMQTDLQLSEKEMLPIWIAATCFSPNRHKLFWFNYAARKSLSGLLAVGSQIQLPETFGSLSSIAAKVGDVFRRSLDTERERAAFGLIDQNDQAWGQYKIDLAVRAVDFQAAAQLCLESGEVLRGRWLSALIVKDYRVMMQGKSSDRSISEKLRLWILSELFPVSGSNRRSISSPGLIRRQERLVELNDVDTVLLNVCVALEQIKTAATVTYQTVSVLLADINLLPESDLRLALLFLAGSLASDRGMDFITDEFKNAYSSESKTLSSGLSSDVLGLLSQTPQVKIANEQHSTALLGGFHRGMHVSRVFAQFSVRVAIAKLKGLVSSRQNAAFKSQLTESLRTLVGDLSQLRGAVQKICQLGLALRTDIPYELKDKATLYSGVSADLNQKQVEMITSRFTDIKMDVLYIEKTPFATGSLSQIHRVFMDDGRDICVKVKIPGIEESLRADFRFLKMASPILNALLPNQDVRGVLQRWEDSTLVECDFEKEADTMMRVRSIFVGSDIAIPRVYKDVSDSNIIVMECVEGQSFYEFLETSTQLVRNQIGRDLWWSTYQLLTHGIYRGDIQPENYRILNGKLVMLDYGAMASVSALPLESHFACMRAIALGDTERLGSLLQAEGWLSNEIGPATRLITQVLGRPFQGVFTFDEAYAAEVYRFITRQLVHMAVMPHGGELIPRLFFSLYSMLGLLKATGDWRVILSEFLFDDAERLKISG